MRITDFSVGGFRNLAPAEISLDGEVRGLVSVNNYGKSNLLDALGYAFSFMGASERQRRAMMRSEENVPLVPSLQNDDYTFSVTIEDVPLPGISGIRYGFSFCWPKNDGSGCRIVGESLEVFRGTRRPLKMLDRNRGMYRSDVDKQRSSSKINLESTQLAIDVLGAMEPKNESAVSAGDVARVVRSLQYGACYPLNVDAAMNDHPLEVEESTGGFFALSSQDLPRALASLREAQPDRFNEFRLAVMTLFPEITSIDVVTLGLSEEERARYQEAIGAFPEDVPYRLRDEVDSIVVGSSYLNQPVDVGRMSDGTKRVIWLLARAVMASCRGVQLLGVEEIETGVHPRMLRDLLETLRGLLGDTQIVFTSHSPFLVSSLSFDELLVGVPTQDGVARFSGLSPEATGRLANGAYDHGMSTGEYLFYLMSSGPDGEDELAGLLRGRGIHE